MAKTDGIVDVAQFEHFVRDDLNISAKRAMCVLKPLLVTLTNFSGQEQVKIEAKNHPNRDDMGSRVINFSEQFYIDQADFSEDTSLSRKNSNV